MKTWSEARGDRAPPWGASEAFLVGLRGDGAPIFFHGGSTSGGAPGSGVPTDVKIVHVANPGFSGLGRGTAGAAAANGVHSKQAPQVKPLGVPAAKPIVEVSAADGGVRPSASTRL